MNPQKDWVGEGGGVGIFFGTTDSFHFRIKQFKMSLNKHRAHKKIIQYFWDFLLGVIPKKSSSRNICIIDWLFLKAILIHNALRAE